jgi:hypothetical protein
MKRMLALMTMVVACAGCVSTPQTKALFTPVGAIGVHSFAPVERTRMNSSEVDRLAHLMQERDQSGQPAE